MASPSEVKENVNVISSLLGHSPVCRPDVAPAGEGARLENSTGQQRSQDHIPCGDHIQDSASKSGLTAQEQTLLNDVRQLLGPVRDLTWPVGLSGNRK